MKANNNYKGGTKIITSLEDEENLNRYFNDIKNIPSLDKETEAQLIITYQKNGDPKALDKLIRANLPFVVTVAKTYQNQGVPLMDLIQEGNSGMIEAAARFDVSRGIKFFSYAVWWIKQKLITNFELNKRLIQMPANRTLLITKVRRVMIEIEKKTERSATIEEIKKHFRDQSLEDIEEAIAFSTLPLSLYQSVVGKDGTDTETSLIEVLEVDNDNGVDEEDREASLQHDLDVVLYQLPQKSYDVLVLSLGLNQEPPNRNEELGAKFGVKDKEIIKIRAKAIKLLQRFKSKINLNQYFR